MNSWLTTWGKNRWHPRKGTPARKTLTGRSLSRKILMMMEILFEAASAIGTVGLSMDFTQHLTTLGKIIIILLMFVGRVGPLTFGMAIFVKNKLIWDDSKTDLAI